MTCHEFNTLFSNTVKSERKITQKILELIQEANKESHHLALGYPTLYDWLTKGHGYSHGAAYRRIQAARISAEMPEIMTKLQDGIVNLTTLAQVQTALRKEERKGKAVSQELRETLVTKMEGKSSYETQTILMAAFPEQNVPKEKVRLVNEEEAKITLVIDKETFENLNRVKELLAHVNPGMNYSELLAYLAKDFVKRKAPEKKSITDKQRVKNPLKLAILKAEGRCEYKDPITGKVCGSRFLVEADHIKPKHLGGTDKPENLRCLCRPHNRLEAERKLGKPLMDHYRQNIKHNH